MPITPQQLFQNNACSLTGSVPWRTRPPSACPGVYVVSLHANPDDSSGISNPPISNAAVSAWIEKVPLLTLDARRPTAPQLVSRLGLYWLPDEAIVYIGKATSLYGRVGGYYSTPLGDKRPHAGGHWIKTLSNLASLAVHYAEICDGRNPEHVEKSMLFEFAQGVSGTTRAHHPQPTLMIPFANLEIKGFARRNHGIANPVVR